MQDFNLLITEKPYQPYYQYWRAQFAPVHKYLHLGRYSAAVAGPRPFRVTRHRLSRQAVAVVGQLAGGDTGQFTVMTAALHLLLTRYAGETVSVFKTPLLAGAAPGDGLAGEVALVVPAAAEPETLRDLLNRVREIVEKSYTYQSFPVDVLLKEVSNLDFGALSNVLVCAPAIHEQHPDQDRFDLVLEMDFAAGGIQLTARYNASLFDALFVERFLAHGEALLLQFDRLGAPLRAIKLLDQAETNYIVNELGSGGADAQCGASDWVTAFEQQVLLSPQRPALVFEEKVITYEQLNDQADRLARHWRTSYGLAKGDCVGVHLPTTDALVVALLAILKADCVFVPVDVSSPAYKKEQVFRNAGVKLLVSQAAVSFGAGACPVFVPGDHPDDAQLPGAAFARETAPGDIAYIMHTSGSEGLPKGVMVSHASFHNYIQWACTFYFAGGNANMALFTSPSFDLTLTSIFCPLLMGKTVFAFHQAEIARTLLRIFAPGSGVDAVKLTPSHITLLGEYSFRSDVKLVIAGGEELLPQHVEVLRKLNPGMAVYNEYGPTETTVGCTVARLDNGLITIGRPVANTFIYILDDELELLPVGAVGELFIAGGGVSEGYLGRPDVTGKKYLDDPFRAGGKMYRSGDLGRWLPGGRLDYLGRRDDQVKFNGYRIEPGEIEAVLENFGGVRQGVVEKRKSRSGSPMLVAYYRAGRAIDPALLRKFLAAHLQPGTIPTHFVHVERFALSASGKLDRQALPDPEAPDRLAALYVPPATATERQLAAIWEEVLGREPVGRYDDFFRLGGHSLHAVQIIARIYANMQVEVSISDLFGNVILADLAGVMDRSQSHQYQPIKPIDPQEHYEASHVQQRLWVLNQLNPGQAAYNVPLALAFSGELDAALVERAFADLLQRHEVLRTTFRTVAGRIRQVVHDPRSYPFKFEYADLREAADGGETCRRLVRGEASGVFDLETGPLLRVKLLRPEEKRYVLLFTVHHIAADGWSMQLIMNEWLHLYQGYRTGNRPALEPLGIQYKDYAAWQRSQLDGSGSAGHKQYWLHQLGGTLPVLQLPVDFHRPPVKTFEGNVVSLCLGAPLLGELKKVCAQHNATLFMGLLALLDVMFYRYTGQPDIIVGTSTAGRSHKDLENQVGCYVNTLPLRTRIQPGDTFGQVLGKAKETATSAFDHQVYPFDQMVEDLGLGGDMGRNPLFEVLIQLQNVETVFRPGTGLEEVAVASYEAAYRSSKFDLTFNFEEAEDGLWMGLDYNVGLFKESTAKHILENYHWVAEAVLADGQAPVEQISLLTTSEEREETDAFLNLMHGL